MAETVTIPLGSRDEVRKLFSYPPNCNEICFIKESLEETITKYIAKSLVRDGYADSTATVEIQEDRVSVRIDGRASRRYPRVLRELLDAGRIALEIGVRLHAEKKWRYNWRPFLPLGIAMDQHQSVQLLHFPPDTVLERDRDYLLASTTRRWASLLVENGVNPAKTDSYQNILDVAPVSAPHSDGASLDGIPQQYTKYIQALLKAWLPLDGGGFRPMVAFGGAVREWIKATFGVTLRVLDVTHLQVTPELRVPVLAANHPSMIFNADDRLVDDPRTPEDERLTVLMRIMREDLIAADWQVRMAARPTSNPVTVLGQCKTKWQSAARQERICQLTYEQVLNETATEAARLCAVVPRPLHMLAAPEGTGAADYFDSLVEKVRNEIGPLECVEREP